MDLNKSFNYNNYTWEDVLSENKTPKFIDFFMMSINATPTSLILLDSKAEFVVCNKSAYSAVGCESVEQYRKDFKNYIFGNPQDKVNGKTFASCVEKAYQEGSHSFDWFIRSIRGEQIPIKIKMLKTNFDDKLGGKYVYVYIHDLNIFFENVKKERSLSSIMKAILDDSPLCLNLWNNKNENVMCNKKAARLFGLNNEQEYLDNFFRLSPEYQPNGELSTELATKYVDRAFKEGYVQFLWLHRNLMGEEIPSEISLSRIEGANGEYMVAGFTRDLRSELAGGDYASNIENYFLDQISDKTLFRVMSQLTEELFFALDIRTSMIRYFGKGKEILGFDDEKTLFPFATLKAGIVYEEDRDIFMEIYQNMINGVFKKYDIRMIFDGKEPRYHRIVYNVKFNNKGKPIFVIGKIVDIHEQRELEMQAKLDLLTNCYNKVSAESAIARSLKENSMRHHVLYIIDIDNFKAINDNLGHHFGDLVLRDIAMKLKEQFRSRDIIGRVGGDEFIVFAENISNQKIIEQKARLIAEAFQNTYSGEDEDYKVSGSIGVSRYPDDGTTFEDLYKSADKALYQSKMRGKDCYTLYSKDFLDGTMKNRTALDNANRMVSSYFDTDLISSIFNLLYEAKNINNAIDATMKVIGKTLNVDRCYIFESKDDGKTYDNTYEWCKDGIRPEIDNLQGLTKEILEDFFRDSNDEGVLYCNDLRTLKAEGAYELMAEQDIKSFLHIQIKSKGYVKLFLGLDDCTRYRVWNEKEINSLAYSAKILSSFLLFD